MKLFKHTAHISILLGSIASLFIQNNKAMASNAPSAYVYTANLAVDMSGCVSQVENAANLVLGRVNQPQYGDGVTYMFGATSGVSIAFTCTQNQQGSTLVVVSSGDNVSDYNSQEAKPLLDRLQQVLSSNY